MKKLMITLISLFILGGFMTNKDIAQAVEAKDKKVETTENKKYVKPSKEELRKKLTPLQYKVTQEDGTERAFDNEYNSNKKEGIYVGDKNSLFSGALKKQGRAPNFHFLFPL